MLEGKRILVVDDEADLREILREELVYENAQVFEAKNGIEAYDILKQNKVDAVLSDMRMPGGDGAVLTQKIRFSFGSKPVVILLTGFADLSSEEAFSIGADGYVSKPFHLSELKKTLVNLMKEPHLRWQKKIDNLRSVYEFNVAIESAMQKRQFNLGRGGACINTPKGHQVVNEFIKIKFDEENYFCGKIVWMRADAETKGQFLGIEFYYLSDAMFETFSKLYSNWEDLLYFIPRSPATL